MKPKLVIPLLLSLFVFGCGQTQFIQEREQVTRDFVSNSVTSETVSSFQNISGVNDYTMRLFKYTNTGIIYFYANEPDSSIKWLHKADRLLDDLYTRRVTQEFSSTVSNQYAVDYVGFPTEHLMVNFFSSLSFLAINDLQGAAVEARKMELRINSFEDISNIYNYSARDFTEFYRYTGYIHLLNKDINNATVSFRLSGMSPEEIQSLVDYPVSKLHVTLSGLVPELYEAFIRIMVETDEDVHSVKYAYPVLFDSFSESHIDYSTGDALSLIRVGDRLENEFTSYRNDQIGKDMRRVVTKFLISSGLTSVAGTILEERANDREEKNSNDNETDDEEASTADYVLGGLWAIGQIMKVVNDVTEKADLRHIFTLPAAVWIDDSPVSTSPGHQSREITKSNFITVTYIPPVQIRRFDPTEFEKTEYFNSDDDENDDIRNRRQRRLNIYQAVH